MERLRAVTSHGTSRAALAVTLRRRAHFWLGLTLGVAVVAVAGAMLLPRWYTSGASLTVDAGPAMGASAGMLGIASQLGIASVGGQSSPLFYGDLLQSRSVQDRILTATLPVGRQGRPTTLVQLWGGTLSPSAAEWSAARRKLSAHMTTSVNARTGVISFSVDGPSATSAKLMADTALRALNDVIVLLRRQRATSERRFLEARWSDAGDSVRAHEARLRSFYERNRIVQSPSLQFEEARLRRDIERLAAIYAQLGTQLEQARIQEIRDTPAVGIIDPPIEPARKSSPRYSNFALAGLVAGAFLSLFLALLDTARLDVAAHAPGRSRSREPVALAEH